MDSGSKVWIQRELQDITSITMGQSPSSKNYTDDPNDYILVQGNADLKEERVYPRIWTTEVTKIAAPGDIILTVRAPVGDVALNDYHVVLGRGVSGIKGSHFVYQLLKRMNMRNYWKRYSTGSTFESINSTDIKTALVIIPSESEQDMIGTTLKTIDDIITLEQEKHELLVNYKKYLIQNVFKQEHSKTKSLKEVATITTGKLNANAMVKDGRYDFYTSGISKYKINEYAFEGPAITIAGNGATVGFMHMANGKFNAYQRTYVLQNFKINRDYLFYNIQKELPRKIHEESRTGSIPYIVMDMLEDLPIYVTDQNKMNQLGNLLYLVNSILDKSSLRIEKIIKTKDFLLQQLFI